MHSINTILCLGQNMYYMGLKQNVLPEKVEHHSIRKRSFMYYNQSSHSKYFSYNKCFLSAKQFKYFCRLFYTCFRNDRRTYFAFSFLELIALSFLLNAKTCWTGLGYNYANLVTSSLSIGRYRGGTEPAIGGVLWKNVFLKISQISLENTWVRVSF